MDPFLSPAKPLCFSNSSISMAVNTFRLCGLIVVYGSLALGPNHFSLPAKIAITLQFSKSNPKKLPDAPKKCPDSKKAVCKKSSQPCSNRVAAPKPAPTPQTRAAVLHTCSTAVVFRRSPTGEQNANQALSPEPFAPAFAFLSSLVREVLAALLAQSIINP